ncbi:MAG: SRPBCC family protein [Planctomycetota bacterium]|jgi:hypothetical protein
MIIENRIRIACPLFDKVVRDDAGPFALGSSAVIHQPGMPPTRWTVSEFVDGERFSWTGKARGIAMKGTHVVVTEGDATLSTLTVEMTGLVASLLSPLLRPALNRSMAQENEALKARCEQG